MSSDNKNWALRSNLQSFLSSMKKFILWTYDDVYNDFNSLRQCVSVFEKILDKLGKNYLVIFT